MSFTGQRGILPFHARSNSRIGCRKPGITNTGTLPLPSGKYAVALNVFSPIGVIVFIATVLRNAPISATCSSLTTSAFGTKPSNFGLTP
ncbi:MAG: hypothetical protein IKO55_17135 [Kiritimatiellae bacterium]|nr:hypothetical protein [Kiritimatiellia bacterium]